MEEDNKEPMDSMEAQPVVEQPVETKTETVIPTEKVEEPKAQVKETKSKFNWKPYAYTAAAIVALVLVYFLFFNNPTPTGSVVSDIAGTGTSDLTSAETVKLDFYVMSQCPYGTQVEDGIYPVLQKIGNNVDFNLNFISTDLGNGEFKSLHGEPETKGNIVQLCAAKYNPDKYMDMIICQNKDARSIPDNWETCATGLDVAKIKSCYEGDEGRELLSENVKLAEAVKASGSPTIFLNDMPYQGGRSETDFLRAICNEFTDKPEACSSIPAPVKVPVVILNDKRCGECDTTQLLGQLKGLFPGMDVKFAEYTTEDGKKLYEDLSLSSLPAVLFGSEIEKSEGYTQVQSYLQPVGDYLSLNIGAAWDPNKEICDNDIDDNKDGNVDCDDSSCANDISCMEKKDIPEVEVFVMSHCPYGTQTEKGILPVMELLGKKADIKIKFVSYAMHGETELDEQLLQHCIQEEQNDKWLSYLKCFLKDGKSDVCLKEVDIDTTKSAECVKATDKEFKVKELFADKATWQGGRFPQFNIHKVENDLYGIRGSPGLALNGVAIDSFGRDPATLLDIVCKGFKEEPSECSETLTSDAPAPGFGFDAVASANTADAGCGA